MNNFDNLFFRTYIGSDNDIKKVFHRHVFVILEDIILWVFFALCIPMFLYSQDIFLLQSSIPRLYVSFYMLFIYTILIYKLFDWYVDVWIMTESTIIDMRWRWFSANILYIPYDKIEGIQVRTRSWWAALLGMSDVVVKLPGGEEFTLYSARTPTSIIEYLQEVAKWKNGHHMEEADREPFDILVDTLSDVVKWHLTTRGKEYITRDYVEKLDTTLVHGKTIDLRTQEEKIIIDGWKQKYQKKGDHGEHYTDDDHTEVDHQGHH